MSYPNINWDNPTLADMDAVMEILGNISFRLKTTLKRLDLTSADGKQEMACLIQTMLERTIRQAVQVVLEYSNVLEENTERMNAADLELKLQKQPEDPEAAIQECITLAKKNMKMERDMRGWSQLSQTERKPNMTYITTLHTKLMETFDELEVTFKDSPEICQEIAKCRPKITTAFERMERKAWNSARISCYRTCAAFILYLPEGKQPWTEEMEQAFPKRQCTMEEWVALSDDKVALVRKQYELGESDRIDSLFHKAPDPDEIKAA